MAFNLVGMSIARVPTETPFQLVLLVLALALFVSPAASVAALLLLLLLLLMLMLMLLGEWSLLLMPIVEIIGEHPAEPGDWEFVGDPLRWF